jgi:Uma2 family endonuclease
MVQIPWRHPPLTKEQADQLFLLMLEDDTEDAPWMTMGDLQFWSASSFAHSLRNYARRQGLPWYVASMLPIIYDVPTASRRKVLSPDTFVAFVPDHPRSSFDVAAEGGVFPPFVLEVVSPSSVEYDQSEKRHAYDALGAREYALFTPREGATSALEGFRRDAVGRFVPWLPDEQGRLWSAVLGLYLVVRGPLLHAQTPDGRLLLTLEEADDARERAEEENERLRRELERLRGQGGG